MSVTEQDLREIGLNIARLRDACGMSQGELADELGISRNTMIAIEHGKSDLRIGMINSVSEALDVPRAALLPKSWEPKSSLDKDMSTLAAMLAPLSPFERSRCMKALFGMAEAFVSVTK